MGGWKVGEIKASASPRQLIEQHTPGYVGLFNLEDKARIQSELQNSGIHFHEDGSNIYLRAQKLDDLISFHVKSNLHPLQIRPANLEDVFLKITGSEINHDA